MSRLRVGTRGSRLALWQASWLHDALHALDRDLQVDLVVFETEGDRRIDAPLPEIGGKGLFTEALEQALFDGHIDVAVHSLKDLPTDLPDGLAVRAYGEREDPRDVLIGKNGACLHEIPAGALIGSSSLRRSAQLRRLRPDLDFTALRGNLDTRLRRLQEDPALSGIVLAAAGVHRLGWHDQISEYFEPTAMLPAAGQGIIAVEALHRRTDLDMALEAVNHPQSACEARAERAFVAALGGGCQLPIGAWAVCRGEKTRLHGMVCDPTGQKMLRLDAEGSDPDTLGARLAAEAVSLGAVEIMAAVAVEDNS
ncbi:MAG: hydroxymethylbilane synthase [Coriobacteriales bacterium]|jgi:hydroxymethylbilane synthase|nr:hydroxymethylbilane synthase [Coriobacteriales bacterium]